MARGRRPVILVDGLTYYELKLRAGLFNGQAHADRLTEEQQVFVGCSRSRHTGSGWIAPTSLNEQALEEAAVSRELAAGYWLLAKKILEA